MSNNSHPRNVVLVHDDLPAGLTFPGNVVAIDTETTGLSLFTDKLCLCQVGDNRGNVWLVKFDITRGPDAYKHCPNLKALLQDAAITKLFHYARFDLAMLQKNLDLPAITPMFCTKIASKLVRPDEGKHNLRTLAYHYLGVTLDKSEQLSNWAAPELTESQMAYAASDVLYLAGLHEKLVAELAAANRSAFMDAALAYLPTRVDMDLADLLPETDVFSHH